MPRPFPDSPLCPLSIFDHLDQSAERLTGRNWKPVLSPLPFNEVLRSQDWAGDNSDRESLRELFGPQLKSVLIQRIAFGIYPVNIVHPTNNPKLTTLIFLSSGEPDSESIYHAIQAYEQNHDSYTRKLYPDNGSIHFLRGGWKAFLP